MIRLILAIFLFLFYQQIDCIPLGQSIDVNEELSRHSDTIAKSQAIGFLPRGVVMAIATTQIDKWFNMFGAGLGEYDGWYLCDGRNGTPDLSGRFLAGRDAFNSLSPFATINSTGGSSSVQLNSNNLPGHTHDVKITSSSSGAHRHNYADSAYGYAGSAWYKEGSFYRLGEIWNTRTTEESGAHNHVIDGKTSSVGGSQAFSVQNPYYVVAYIIYLGY